LLFYYILLYIIIYCNSKIINKIKFNIYIIYIYITFSSYKSIEFLEEYIISYADPSLKRLPDPIPKSIVKIILDTWWKMGILWSRIIVIPNDEEKEGEEVSKDESMKNEYLDNINKR